MSQYKNINNKELKYKIICVYNTFRKRGTDMENNKNKIGQEINELTLSLLKKDKRSFKCELRLGWLRGQAEIFSPTYRDFIIKVINNGSLKIYEDHHNGEAHINGEYKQEGAYPNYAVVLSEDEYKEKKKEYSQKELEENTVKVIESESDDGKICVSYLFLDTKKQTEPIKLIKRAKNTIYIHVREPEGLPHELGHAVDFWFGIDKALTRTVIIEDNKTLYDIFTEEFNNKYKDIYESLMNEYKEVITANINAEAYDVIMNNMYLYQRLKHIPVNLKDKKITAKRRFIQNELYNRGFVEYYYQLINKKCSSLLNKKYSPILDALSSKYDFEGYNLDYHKFDYYLDRDKFWPVQEFFANVFDAKVTSKTLHYDNLIKLLPKSFEAFEKLFDIFYKHIQNNKRFVDVKTIER